MYGNLALQISPSLDGRIKESGLINEIRRLGWKRLKQKITLRKKYGIIITAVLLILGFIVLYEWKNFESYKPVVGSPAPDFELKDLNKKIL